MSAGAICAPCGARLGRGRATRSTTWSTGDCGWCGEHTSVTEPRDYGYPPAPASFGERPSPLPSTSDASAVPAPAASGPPASPGDPHHG